MNRITLYPGPDVQPDSLFPVAGRRRPAPKPKTPNGGDTSIAQGLVACGAAGRRHPGFVTKSNQPPPPLHGGGGWGRWPQPTNSRERRPRSAGNWWGALNTTAQETCLQCSRRTNRLNRNRATWHRLARGRTQSRSRRSDAWRLQKQGGEPRPPQVEAAR
jgi:hypothetical protein